MRTSLLFSVKPNEPQRVYHLSHNVTFINLMAVTLLTRCRAFSFSGKNEERVILLRFYVDMVK